MYATMRSIATDLAGSPGFSGHLRLYISTRQHESIYAISDLALAQPPFSADVLYVINWVKLKNSMNQLLPRNIFCVGAPSLERPTIPSDCNLLLTDAVLSVEELYGLLFGDDPDPVGLGEASYASQLLGALYTGNLDQLCDTASALFGNPVFFLNFNYSVITVSLRDSENPEVLRIRDNNGIDADLLALLHDTHNRLQLTSGAIFTVPGSATRFFYMPITQTGIHLASILLFEDRVSISEDDRQLLTHVARCFRLLHPMIDPAGSTRLIYEYALVRHLSDNYTGEKATAATRFSTLGYQIKSFLYVMVLNRRAEVDAEVLQRSLNTLSSQIRHIMGNNGLVTPFRDHVVVLFNLETPSIPSQLLESFRLFCVKNDLWAGLSPRFSDIEQLRKHYRYALDAVGLGSLFQRDECLYFFEDLRIYKFITVCARSFPLTELIPDNLHKLIEYDHRNNSQLLETLYYYVYTVKNTKIAAELLHIHRNTLLYRLEKVRGIMEVDLDDGDVFLQLMLAFKFLEFDALQGGRPLCFTPIPPKKRTCADPE